MPERKRNRRRRPIFAVRSHELTSKVANVDFASIGVFGLLLFIYAAIALADSVEYLFNRIYDAPRGRPIHLRLAIHWSIITLGSGLLALSLYMSGQVVDWFASSNMKLFMSHALSIAAAFVLLFLLYALMPNTHVSVRAAGIGAIVGALLWEAAKFGFKIYVVTAVPYSALYGSLGLIPLFLFWIYVTWLIVLFGLILTYTLQTLRGRRFVKSEQVEKDLIAGDPDWMLPIMSEVAHAFEAGRTIGIQEVADRLGLSSRVVHEMSGKLIDAEILRKIAGGTGEEESLTLAKPAEKITVAEILTLAHRTRPVNDNPGLEDVGQIQRCPARRRRRQNAGRCRAAECRLDHHSAVTQDEHSCPSVLTVVSGKSGRPTLKTKTLSCSVNGESMGINGRVLCLHAPMSRMVRASTAPYTSNDLGPASADLWAPTAVTARRRRYGQMACDSLHHHRETSSMSALIAETQT